MGAIVNFTNQIFSLGSIHNIYYYIIMIVIKDRAPIVEPIKVMMIIIM